MKAGDEVLQGRAGTTACLLGNLAIVRGALEAGVQFVSGYPGTPASEIGDTFARIASEADVLFEYSVNEKIAVEIAFAASQAGARSLCSMKHVGLSYAGDPISTIPYVGVGGGMVIVSAGDPSAITSPNEQDQRHYSSFLFYPVFDPATPEDAKNMTRYAFDFSERTRLPVLLRPTTRVCHTSGMVRLGQLPQAKNALGFEKDPNAYVPIPANVQRMRRELSARWDLAEQLLGESDFFSHTGDGKHGIVAGGVPYAYLDQVIRELGLESDVSVLKVGAYPIPESVLSEFLASVESVLVVEELTPFIEDTVTLSAYRNRVQIPILGKRTGHFPEAFEYSPELVEDAVRNYLQLGARAKRTLDVPELPPRPPVLCAGCSHRTSFYLTRKVFGKKTVYCNDIGCYTLGYGEVLDSCDTVLCMGSSITQASGIARMTGERAVAYIGDSTFFHSGLPALVNAVQADDAVTVVILNNYVTGMTGFQPSPTTTPHFNIEDAVKGLGVHTVLSANPFEEDLALDVLKQARGGTGVNVVVFNAPCVVNETKLGTRMDRPAYEVDQVLCNECSLCVRLIGCPAIFIEDGRYVIDQELCDGCDLCASVCNRGAIHALAPVSPVK